MTLSSQDKFSETKFWDLVARQRVYAAFDTEEYNEVFDRSLGNSLSGKTIIDIGCASGISAALLASRGANVIGVDISPDLIAQAKQLWKEYEDKIDFRVGDAEQLDASDNSADACFFGGVLHHFPDLERAIVEAYRVLRVGGQLVALEPNRLDGFELIEWAVADLRGKLSPNEYPIDPHALKTQLAAAGFVNVRFWTTRNDIPVLAQIPLVKKCFSRQRGFSIKRPILRFVDAFRPPESRGTFFVMVATKR